MTQQKKRPLIAGNWKMHMTHLEAIEVVQKLSYVLDPTDYEEVEIVLCPPFTALRSVQTVIDADKLKFGLGAQNCHFKDKGAFTGEIAPPMLKKLDVSYVIVGHSERRQYFGETDEMVAKKARAVRDHEMIPIICVGETLEQRESGLTEEIVQNQTAAALSKIVAEEAGSVVIAYEPIWAIGTGKNASVDEAGEVIVKIKEVVGKLFGPEAGRVRVLYGGSVKAGNIAGFISHPAIDGALVGGASLDPEEFGRIIRYSRPAN